MAKVRLRQDLDAMSDDRLELLRLQADAYLAAHDFGRLLEVGQAMIAEAPRSHEGYLITGRAYLVVEERRRALRLLKQGLARAPRSHEAHYLLAVCYREMKKLDLAEEHIEQAIRLAPWDPDVWCEAGTLSLERDFLGAAIGYARSALQIDTENSTAHNLIGMALPEDLDGLSERKVEAFHRALQADPENPYAYNNLGVEYLRVGRSAKAEEYFRKALRLAPEVKRFRENLHVILRNRFLLYRLLRGPGDLLVRLMRLFEREWGLASLVVGAPLAFIWLYREQYYMPPQLVLLVPLALWVIWLVIFWPLIKMFEWLTLSDLRLAAGEVDPYRSPWDLRRWPRWVRFPLFLLVVIGVWTGLTFALMSKTMRISALVVVGVGVLIVLVWGKVYEPFESRASDYRWKQLERTGGGSRR
jgi:tetratricopeptide (TPR) repeat protein